MAQTWLERILILAKTYPSPSAQHVETSCVAGINEQGLMRRLYPVPFRLLQEGQQFQKWQWIDVRVEKARQDHRPESHRLYVDTVCCRNTISSHHGWELRRPWLTQLPTFDDFDAIQAACTCEGISLALLRPKRVLALEITPARSPDWTDEEKAKLLRQQMQDDLFSEDEERRQIRTLRKVPYDFYYRYCCNSPVGERSYRHKIVDWEAGALYWNCRRSHGHAWEMPFREQLEQRLQARDLMFLMGNQHRFQDQWLIISLIYPPKPAPAAALQGSLF